MNEFKIQELQPTNSIRFYSGQPDSIEVLRISRDGLWANPDTPMDEAARLVLKALDASITQMVARAVEAELDACAELLLTLDLCGQEGKAAQAIRARKNK